MAQQHTLEQRPIHAHWPSVQRGFAGEAPVLKLRADIGGVLSGALDELACGVMVVDAQSRLIHCNLAAQAVLARGECVCLQDGVLGTTQAIDTKVLTGALSKAASGKRSMIALGALSRTTVAVVPLRNEASTASAGSVQHFALMFSRAGVCEALMLSFFSRAHKLTAAEECVLGLMCVGLTAPEMAQRLLVGEATVRTHVRNICAKTNSSGIREVIKRLAVLPPLMAAVMPGAFGQA